MRKKSKAKGHNFARKNKNHELQNMQTASVPVRNKTPENAGISTPTNPVRKTKVEINKNQNMEKYIIQKVTKKPFKSSEGEMIDYFWYKAVRISDKINIDFGSTASHEVSETPISLEVIKVEKADGSFRYKEPAVR